LAHLIPRLCSVYPLSLLCRVLPLHHRCGSSTLLSIFTMPLRSPTGEQGEQGEQGEAGRQAAPSCGGTAGVACAAQLLRRRPAGRRFGADSPPGQEYQCCPRGQFRTLLASKAACAGKHVEAVSPHYTSQDWKGCGERVPKRLRLRT